MIPIHSLPTEFLKSYHPQDKHFTSKEEIEKIDRELNLSTSTTTEIQDIRNAVVQYYSLLKRYTEDRDESWAYTESMMSVTAVIDYYKVRVGMEV